MPRCSMVQPVQGCDKKYRLQGWGKAGGAGSSGRFLFFGVGMGLALCFWEMSARSARRVGEQCMEVEHGLSEWEDDAVLPVSVVVGRDAALPAGEQWRVQGVVVGQRFASDQIRCLRMRSAPEGDLYMWMGYHLKLRKASVEDYAYNVNSPEPVVFVIARQDEADGLRPLQVTVSLDDAQNLDATDLRSVDEQVARVAMPPEVYRWLERFVLDHYVPRKRKRKFSSRQHSKSLFDAEVNE